jgi:hypothetical protein
MALHDLAAAHEVEGDPANNVVATAQHPASIRCENRRDFAREKQHAKT